MSSADAHRLPAVVGDPSALAPRLRLAVAAWLGVHEAAPLTHALYTAEMQRFIAEMQRAALTLDADPGLVAVVVERWASAGGVSAATFNKRVAVISSFYRYASTKRLISPPNPCDLIVRRRVQRTRAAQPLELADVRRALAAIPRDTLAGQRDHCLLSVALTTGRRRAELAGLRWSAVHLAGDRVRLTWRAKGDQVFDDLLPVPLSRLLLAYLHRVYGAQLGTLDHAAAIWVSVSNNQRGGALSVSAIADICAARLGTSKVHALRHTFARQMEAAGAPLSLIQQRLGHASAATTAIYLQRLHTDENPQAEALALALGL